MGSTGTGGLRQGIGGCSVGSEGTGGLDERGGGGEGTSALFE